MKTLKATIAILVLTIVSNVTFGQDNHIDVKNILESDLAIHKCNHNHSAVAALKVCPMQIAEGIVVLKLNNQPQGNYTVQIVDENGVVLMAQAVNHNTASTSETVKFGKTLAGGTYTVNVVAPDNNTTSETVMLFM
ncbi:MAG: hypothetical protein V4556_08470 [Bacteroidota bacterium]